MAKKALVAYANNNLFSINRPSIDFYPEFCSCTVYLYTFLNIGLCFKKEII